MIDPANDYGAPCPCGNDAGLNTRLQPARTCFLCDDALCDRCLVTTPLGPVHAVCEARDRDREPSDDYSDFYGGSAPTNETIQADARRFK